MEKDYTVRTFFTYPDGQKKVEEFRLMEYVWYQSKKIKQLLYEMENIIGRLESTSDKEKWDADTKRDFAKMRSHVFDAANAFLRLPSNLHYKGVPCCGIDASEAIAAMVDKY